MNEGPIEPTEIPKPEAGWWENVPVLRELYKLLSERGAVNWELARQVGTALGSADEPDAGDPAEMHRDLEAMTRGAEVKCEELTGLSPASVVPVAVVSRAEWVEANLSAFEELMEPLANKLTGSGLGIPVPPQAQQVLRQVSGILLGLQTGFVLGYLSQHVIGQYETHLPDPEGGRLLYVAPNLVAVEREWELDPQQFRYWIALHEMTHHLQFSRPWVRPYFRGQLRTLVESLDFEPGHLQTAFEGLDLLDPERLVEALNDPEALFAAARSPLSEDTMQRLQAFMTITEGYATWVMDAVGAELLSDHARLKEVMERRKHSRSPGDVLLDRLLGLEIKRRQYEEGVAFCRYVVGMRDVASLNRVWDNPDSLPTGAEISDADAWISRVLDQDADTST